MPLTFRFPPREELSVPGRWSDALVFDHPFSPLTSHQLASSSITLVLPTERLRPLFNGRSHPDGCGWARTTLDSVASITFTACSTHTCTLTRLFFSPLDFPRTPQASERRGRWREGGGVQRRRRWQKQLTFPLIKHHSSSLIFVAVIKFARADFTTLPSDTAHYLYMPWSPWKLHICDSHWNTFN